MDNSHKYTKNSGRKRRRANRQRMLLTVVGCVAVLAVTIGVALMLIKTAAGAGEQGAASSAATTEAAPTAEPAPEAAPAPTEEPPAQAVAAAQANATGAQPEVKDPATWDANGKAIMEQLAADPAYEGLDLAVKEGQPYLAAVNRAASTVTIYTADGEGKYTKPYLAMVCSGGTDTPTGCFETPVNYQWRLLAGPSYGQYATRIWDSYLFHSVPYYSQHKDDVEYDEYNKLGTLASLGCIRLAVADVKWIFDNCPIGMPVVIYDYEEDPGPMGKPGTIYTDPADEAKRGWDPTDPDPANPWDPQYRSGTAIRSDAAQAEWDAAMADGRWNESINPADLQGWSTDSAKEGTRG